MIKLYGFGKRFGVIDASPFVVKVDLFMRIAGIEFESENDFNNIKKSPKGKLPFIEDNGNKIGDSAQIIRYLTQTYNLSLDDQLTEQQKAQAIFATHCLDESLYWCLIYSRWVHQPTWQVVKEGFFSKLPIPLKWFLPGILQKGVKKTLHRQGYGRHSLEELVEKSDQVFSSLSIMLAGNDYFFGGKPSSFDAVAYSVLCQFISFDFDNPFIEKARQYDNLIAFCQRIEKEYYS